MVTKTNSVAFAAIFLLFTACNVSVNQSISVENGETREGSLNVVNGSITVGDSCTIKGDCRVVNGNIEIGHDSEVESIKIVNGPIEIGSNSRVHNSVKSVNGSITCAAGVEIGRDVETVNGAIELTRTMVAKSIQTINGDISLLDSSRVAGDIRIEGKSKGGEHRRLEIKIKDGSVVEGDVLVEDKRAEVKVYLGHGGQVLGQVLGAEVIQGESGAQ